MKEQTPIPPRRSATVDAHRAGHYSGLHPDDAPYITAQRQRYPHNPLDLADNLDFQDAPTRSPTSAKRWIATDGSTVIQGGNKRVIIHKGQPPRRIHWVLILWIGMLSMIAFYLLWTWGSNWWTNHQLDATFGIPRTYQTDQVVGHSDSSDRPSHFIFLNLSGHVLIIELPGGDSSHAKIYSGPQIFADNPQSVPVTGEFKDVNGDGKVDMIVHIQDQRIIYLNDGSQFKPQS